MADLTGNPGAPALLTAIRQGTRLFFVVSAYKLPLWFDPAPLASEIPVAESRSDWIAHWADRSAVPGTWASIPLLNLNGGSQSVDAGLPHLRSVVESFQTRVLRARLMKLTAGATIGEHRDYAYFGGQRWSFERGRIRVHIPIVSNPGVIWILDGNRIELKAGEAWYVNVCLPHSVQNRGNTDRIHLVLELEVNDWLRKMFPPQGWHERLWGATLRQVEPRIWRLARSLLRRGNGVPARDPTSGDSSAIL
jgi:mannose-6-phosphate isomerase-like protein (cupin superfamily)